ncbi:MAG: hypothetical protein JNJ60_22400, partial [Rhodocyclaceae bacterium]|nr:hypothetical protein [Rhodocyclaceae bacterium]
MRLGPVPDAGEHFRTFAANTGYTKPDQAMDIDFACTRCGNCCRNLRLPLSAGEARQWIADGHPVEVLCEAIVWPGDPPQPNPYAAY